MSLLSVQGQGRTIYEFTNIVEITLILFFIPVC